MSPGDLPAGSDATTPPLLRKADRIAAWVSARNAIDVMPIRHPIIEALGHHPTSDYAWFWLPIVGPTSLILHRRLTTGFVTHPTGYRLDLATLGQEIGLGAGVGRNAPITRSVARLVHFQLADIVDDKLGVSTSLPPLTARQAARLPAHLATRHRRFAEPNPARQPATGGCSVEAGR